MIAKNSDTLFLWDGMTNSETGAYVNGASVNATLKSLDGSSLATFTLTHDDEGTGSYYGTLDSTDSATLTEGNEYLISITATSGDITEVREERHTCEMRSYGG